MARQQKTKQSLRWLKVIPHHWEILILFVLSWTPFFWYGNDQIVLGHDSGYRLDMWKYLQSLWFSWNPTLGFGADWTINKGFLITQLPEVLFTQLTGSLSIGQRLSFVLWFFLIGMGMYLFVRRFFSEEKWRIFRLSASVMYVYNFFLLQGWFITERAKFSLFAALPVGLLLAYQSFVEQKHVLRNALLFGFLFFVLNGGSSPPLFGAVLITYAVTWLYGVWIATTRAGWKNFFRILVQKVGIAILFFIPLSLFNAYWVVPQALLLKEQYSSSLSSIGGIEEILAWERVVSASASFANLFRLQGIPDWYDMPSHTYSGYFLSNTGLIVLSFFPLLCIVLGLVFRHRVKETMQQRQIYFLVALLCITSVFFTAGSHPPLGGVYAQFIQRIPGFAMFRSSIYKFGPAFWFSIIFLTSYSLNVLLAMWPKFKVYATQLTIASVLLVLFYHFPFFKAHFFNFNPPFSTKLTVPAYVNEMNAYVDSTLTENDRIALVPELYRDFAVDSYRWGFWSFDLFPRLVFSQSIVANASVAPDDFVELYDALNRGDQRSFDALSRLFGISHFLWRGDTLYHDKQTTAADMGVQRTSLRDFSTVTLERQMGPWELYRFATPSALFELSDQPIVADQTVPISTVLADSVLSSSPALFLTDPAISSRELDVSRVISARCISCSSELSSSFILPDHLPYVRFLPDHPLYRLIRFKERAQLYLAQKNPLRLVNLHFVMAGKRLRELLTLSEKNTHTQLSAQTFLSQIKETERAVQQLSEPDRQLQQRYLLALLRFYQPFLNNSRFEDVRKENERVVASIEQVLNETVPSQPKDDPARKLYQVDVPESSIYQISIDSSLKPSVKIAGSLLDSRKALQLSKGLQEIEVQLPMESLVIPFSPRPPLHTPEVIQDSQRLLRTSAVESGRYVLTLDYRIPDKQAVNLRLIGEGPTLATQAARVETIVEERLDPRTDWTTYRKSVVLPHSLDSLQLAFQMNEKELPSGVELRNLQLTRDITPHLYLSDTKRATGSALPVVRYQKINPTVYQVDIEAVTPAVLIFRQNFHPGWRLYPAESSWIDWFLQKPVAAESHQEVNRFANSWIVDARTPRSLVVVYWPQVIFQAAVLVSFISLSVGVGVLILLRKSHRE